ncbi:zinc-ribbon domain-containing protein [Cryobacterium sp. 10I5]|uniref:zinc-ribbon domain-containing protein n=1 Tax=Cryobacterium sp. 10I5 TaxID=3048581 RepID=UPI003A59979D
MCEVKVAAAKAVCAFCNQKRPIPGLSDLEATHPFTARFWNPIRNAPREIHTVSAGSAYDAWWRCPDRGHEFQRPVYQFVVHPSCPGCRDPHRYRAVIDVRSKYPQFARQWDPERNSSPEPPPLVDEYRNVVWWICDKGHPFSSTVRDRQRRDGNCPICTSRRLLPGVTDLGAVYPSIAFELHPTLNDGLRAENIFAHSQKKLWWLCPNGHEYQCVVAVRTRHWVGCTKCTGRRIVEGETDLGSAVPEVASRWHPTMNGALTPADVHPGSAQKAWFTCRCGKPYQTEIRMMRPDRYCRKCTDYLRWHAIARREGVGASL